VSSGREEDAKGIGSDQESLFRRSVEQASQWTDERPQNDEGKADERNCQHTLTQGSVLLPLRHRSVDADVQLGIERNDIEHRVILTRSVTGHEVMAKQPSVVVVLTTISTEEQATALAHQLLNEHLIACSTVIPAAASHYRWGGKVTSETEAVLMIKTTSTLVERLKARILELHPYDIPEFIVLEASDVAEAYAAWIEASTKTQEN